MKQITANNKLQLGQLLQAQGIVTAEQIEQLLAKQSEKGYRKLLGELLVEEGYCTENQIAAALAQAYSVPYAQISPKICDPKVLERLRKKLHRLLENEKIAIDETRLAQEAAMIAERADVCEELTRLRSHVDQFRAISSEVGPVGRRLDFLLQEMSREATTTGAKTQDATMQHKIVDLRGELARMREQIQNIE